jgi:class 3 adenylate cyclase
MRRVVGQGQRPAYLLAVGVWLAALVAIGLALVVWADRGFPPHPASFATGPLGVTGITVAGVVYATAGLWLVGRAPRNQLGWVILLAGAGLAAVLVLNQYIEAAIHPFRPVPTEAITMAWVIGAVHLPLSAAATVVALLLFPSGRLEWPPMWATLGITTIGCALLVLGTALYPDGQLWYPTLPSPFEPGGELGSIAHTLSMLGIAFFVPAFALTAVCLAWRYRHGSVAERGPLAWVTLGGTVLAITLSALFIGRYSGLTSDADGTRLTLLAGLGAIVLPLALVRFYRASATTGVAVRDVTFLFTDLADSAAMYRRFGDRPAFDLVRVHLDTLRALTRSHHGVVVKTIGDAIMAAFAQPSDAVVTAVEMFERVRELNEGQAADLVLKVGVHRGPAILVGSPDHPDYFGQTVNAAARLQAVATAGEICLSDEILLSRDVAGIIAGYEVSTEITSIRGVADDMTIHRVHITWPADGSVTDGRSSQSQAQASETASASAPGG